MFKAAVFTFFFLYFGSAYSASRDYCTAVGGTSVEFASRLAHCFLGEQKGNKGISKFGSANKEIFAQLAVVDGDLQKRIYRYIKTSRPDDVKKIDLYNFMLYVLKSGCQKDRTFLWDQVPKTQSEISSLLKKRVEIRRKNLEDAENQYQGDNKAYLVKNNEIFRALISKYEAFFEKEEVVAKTSQWLSEMRHPLFVCP